MARRAWKFNQDGLYSEMNDSTVNLINKRRRALTLFMETGDTSEARAYCDRYKVPVPKDEDAFRRHLVRAANRSVTRTMCEPKAKPKKSEKPKKQRKGRKRKFTKEQLDKGLKAAQIAENLGCDKKIIYIRIKEYGLEYEKAKSGRKAGTKSWTAIDRDELQRLCDEGLSIERIAREMDVGVGIVTRNIKEYGIERKDLRRRTDKKDREAVKEKRERRQE